MQWAVCSNFCYLTSLTLTFSAILLSNRPLSGQDAIEAQPVIEIPEIADEPKTIDPATLVPASLATEAAVKFENSSLRELVSWLEGAGLVVLLDNRALTEQGISLGEPVSDRLDNAPIYLLLNRLRALQLSWYVDDGILHITTLTALKERQSTQPYNVGDLLDLGYGANELIEVLTSGVAVESWEENGGGGSIELLGDVLFVRQNDAQHLEVRGLLQGLRKHGRRTFTLDPPQHLSLREKLSAEVSVAFEDTPLETAIGELAVQAKADIRLDRIALRAVRVRDREPVSLKLSERNLGTVLRVMLSDLDLTWILRDGVLWVTSNEEAEYQLKSAVFDVRDLCRDDDESSALQEAIVNQTTANWEELGGNGTIYFPQNGTMVVRQTERSLDEVLKLLETYRTALRGSKPRDRSADLRKEVVTRYYQLQSQIAEDLESHLPRLVAVDTWRSDEQPTRAGTVLRIASTTTQTETSIVEQSVLIVRQTREVHDEIAAILERIKNGDPQSNGGGFGGGGQGFGGGLFNVSPKKPKGND